MALYIVKLLLSAGLIVLISEVAKRSAHLGALIGSLPLVSILAILWLYIETNGEVKRVQDYATGVFWYVLPSLVFFIALPLCLNRLPFWASLAIATAGTFVAYLVMAGLLAKFGFRL